MTRSLIDFESTQPFATRFFTEALNSEHMVNAYILRGKDFGTMYRMVLRLAQLINCQQQETPVSACGQCQPCRWIEENAHPGVITVSNLTYLVDVDPETGASRSKTGKPQQSIVVGQLEILLRELSLHSGGFHRVVILTGAQESTVSDGRTETFPPPKDWRPSQNGEFQLTPLDRKLFPERLANKFLKTLEEPPMDVIFFLLTDSEEKLLETVVSRCQTVPFVTPKAFYQTPLSPQARTYLSELTAKLPEGNFIHQLDTLSTLLAEANISSTDALAQFQQFLWDQFAASRCSKNDFPTIQRYLQQLEHAKTMIRDKAKEEAVLEDLFLQMSSQ